MTVKKYVLPRNCLVKYKLFYLKQSDLMKSSQFKVGKIMRQKVVNLCSNGLCWLSILYSKIHSQKLHETICHPKTAFKFNKNENSTNSNQSTEHCT